MGSLLSCGLCAGLHGGGRSRAKNLALAERKISCRAVQPRAILALVTVALREQCQRAVLAALQKRDWQLVDSTDAFVQAVVREAGAQPSSDRIQLAIVRCYGAVLYAACCGENFWRRNRAFQELGAYVYPIVRRRLHHVDEVADARQQVLLKVWQHRAECR